MSMAGASRAQPGDRPCIPYSVCHNCEAFLCRADILTCPAGHNVDTFFRYGGGSDVAVSVVDAKAASLRVTRKEITLEESRVALNKSLSSALKNGHLMVLACQESNPDMDALCYDGFPLDALKKGGKEIITDQHAEKIITDADEHEYRMRSMTSTGNVKIPNKEFAVAVTSYFEKEDLDDFLFAKGMAFGSIGKKAFQIISIKYEEGTPLLD
jgi:hypothetical protein